MDLRILFSMLSVMFSGILHTVTSAPAGETRTASSTVTPVHHVRTKRCSCATFLDKECVYFCHLDIIWVNTPERIVSYGLGSAPRKRRAAATVVTKKDARCKCLRENDNTCANFCQMENRLRYNTLTDKVILSAQGDGCAEMQCKHTLAGKTSRIKRVNSSDKRAKSAVALRAALKTRLLLEKWRVRQHHRARAWEGESTAS